MKKTRRRKWIPIAVVAALLIGAGLFAWFGVDHHFAPADKPRKFAREGWLALTDPPLIRDAPAVSFPSEEVVIKRRGSNLTLEFPEPPKPEDELWRKRVDSVIRGATRGSVDLGNGDEIRVSHLALRWALNSNGLTAGNLGLENCSVRVFRFPEFEEVDWSDVPADLQLEIRESSNPVNRADVFVRFELPDSVLELRRPILADRVFQSTVSATPANPIPESEDAPAIARLVLTTWHASNVELWATVAHQPAQPLVFEPKRGQTATIPEADLDVRLLLAESVGFYTPGDGPAGWQHLQHTRYNLSTSAIQTEPHVRQDRFFHEMLDEDGTPVRAYPSKPDEVSPWQNPFLINVAQQRMEFVDKIRVTYARRVDRIAIPIGKLPLPGAVEENLLDITIPYAEFETREQALEFVGLLTQFQPPAHSKPSSILLPESERRHANLTYQQLLSLIETPNERVVIDLAAEAIRLGSHDPWHRRAWQKIKSWWPGG